MISLCLKDTNRFVHIPQGNKFCTTLDILITTQIVYTDSRPAKVTNSDPKPEPSSGPTLQTSLPVSLPGRELERVVVVILGWQNTSKSLSYTGSICKLFQRGGLISLFGGLTSLIGGQINFVL